MIPTVLSVYNSIRKIVYYLFMIPTVLKLNKYISNLYVLDFIDTLLKSCLL